MRPVAEGDGTWAAEAPAADTAVATLHESEHTRVTRQSLANGGATVICKEPLGPDSDRRLRHELAILERLAGVDGVCQLADVPPRPGSLLFEDVDGAPLADTATPLAQADVVRIGSGLADVLAAVHHRGVILRDINPTNILLSRGTPSLIDFERAITVTDPDSRHLPADELGGTLAYLAPEQTGRTGRPVDERADLYALGATLYELATGRPPFATTNLLRLSHDQLARVPTPPVQVNPVLSSRLSDIIMHLLEKEPDNRYQTAEGLRYDLTRLAESAAPHRPLGSHDFPLGLGSRARLVGREADLATLVAAFAEAQVGRTRGILISGVAGVGKTSLIHELRPLVTADGGRFVTGKFDQYRQDQDFDAVRQAIRALGRLLLAEPEAELARLRPRILATLGANAGMVATMSPEFALLLRIPPDYRMGDPLRTQARLAQVGLDLLRVVASPEHPLVMFIDDLQWASATPLRFIDAVLGATDLDGLLLVGAYRDDEVDSAHPLGEMLARWRELGTAPRHLRLRGLPVDSLATMLADTLRLEPEQAHELAAAVEPRTGGNPFDTAELIDALRRDGTLRQAGEGWQWDADTLRRHLGRADVTDLLAARADDLPAPTRQLLETVACLGGQVNDRLLYAATGADRAALDERLGPALDDGLVVAEEGADNPIRFRHDRIQESILGRLAPRRRQALRLDLARRLAGEPDLVAVAAEQYLPVIDLVQDPAERAAVVGLLHKAAVEAQLQSNYAAVQRLVDAAVPLHDNGDDNDDGDGDGGPATLVDLETLRLTALYSLGRLADADEVYARIDRLRPSPLARTAATLVQVSSLTNRGRPRQALHIGLAQLEQLGITVPPPEQLSDEITLGLDTLDRLAAERDVATELTRPEIDDPSVLATAALVNRLMPPAYFCDQPVMQWLTLTAIELWSRHGPGRTLIGPVSHVAFVTAGLRRDYRTGHDLLTQIMAVSEARQYDPDTSQSWFLYALGSGHWFSALETNVRLAQRARDGLVRGGDLQNACYSYYVTVQQLIEYAPSLDAYAVEVESALTFAARTGNEDAAEVFHAYQAMAHALRGGPVGLRIAPDTDAQHLPVSLPDKPIGAANQHVSRALTAALLDDGEGLAQQVAAAMPLLPFIEATYPTVVARLLHGLVLSSQLRSARPGPDQPASGDGTDRAALLAALDTEINWLAERAGDAAVNFHHLVALLRAERWWAVDDFRSAAADFDAAQSEVIGRRRPWHHAFILERAARFQLAYGMNHAGYQLLGQARQAYEQWGATAKVADLDRAHPLLWSNPHGAQGTAPARPDEAVPAASITTGAIDLLAILEASRALSSEKSLDGLRARVVDVLSAMTGATTVHFILWNDDTREWWMPASDGAGAVPVEQADGDPPPVAMSAVPVSAVRYVERTREPLVVADATRDDRFARDPYLAGLDRCSLLVVPILNRGNWQAMLLLENSLIRGAFSTERLDGVMLIAGQLAVSLDNTLVYRSLERKVAERTQALAVANERLETLSVTDPLTGLANRRRLEDTLDTQWRWAQRSGQPIGVAMVDVDHFKLYNDHYGHPAGDMCLRRIATELRRSVRDTDLAARYGGEEFAVVMPDTDIGEAHLLAQRLRAAVEALAEPHAATAESVVTVSIGVASMHPSDQGTQDELVELADIALYRAKRNGRNRVQTSQHVRSTSLPRATD